MHVGMLLFFETIKPWLTEKKFIMILVINRATFLMGDFITLRGFLVEKISNK